MKLVSSGQIRGCARLLLALCAALLFAPQSALAQSASVNPIVKASTATTTIVTPLSFFKVADINFGSIAPGNTAGTVVLSPFNVVTTTGGVTARTGSTQPASFAGLGSNNQTVTISVTANSRLLTRVGGTQTMRIDTFVIGSTPTANLTTVPLAFRINSPTGQFSFPVGATLRVSANQTPGIYQGSFSVTLNYL